MKLEQGVGGSELGRPRGGFTKDHLPAGSSAAFSMVTGLLRLYVGQLDQPWTISDKDARENIQICWNQIFPHIPYTVGLIPSKCPVYSVVSWLCFISILVLLTIKLLLRQTRKSPIGAQ